MKSRHFCWIDEKTGKLKRSIKAVLPDISKPNVGAYFAYTEPEMSSDEAVIRLMTRACGLKAYTFTARKQD